MLLWMYFCLASATGDVGQVPVDTVSTGWLWSCHPQLGAVGQPYFAAEGDLVFFTTRHPGYWIGYALARTGHPFHCGIVVREAGGQLVVLEVGGAGRKEVTLRAVEERLVVQLVQYRDNSPAVWIRQRRWPLTAEQSEQLTCFTEVMRGRQFSSNRRLALLGFPPCMNPKTNPNQPAWFCSEMVTQAMRISGLIPCCAMEPSLTRPRDLFVDLYPEIVAGWRGAVRWNWNATPPLPGPKWGPR